MKRVICKSFLGRVLKSSDRVYQGRENLKGFHRPDMDAASSHNILVIENAQTGKVLFSVDR